MNYLQKKKLAFMSIVNSVKGFVRKISGMSPLTLPDCVDNDSLINYTIDGNSVQNGEPTPDTPIEVESVGEYDGETGKYKIPVVCGNKTTNIYLDEPLRKITNSRNGLSFADYIDYEKQQLVRNIYRQHIAIVDSKSSSGNVFLSSIDKRPYQTPSVVDNTTSVIGYAISNTFKQWNREYVMMRLYGGYITSYITTGGALRVAYTFIDGTINTVAKAQTAIGDGFYVYYVLDEPEETPITLPKLPTIRGTTVYTIGTTIQPTNMSATYYATSKE